jgi:hypothetical protein
MGLAVGKVSQAIAAATTPQLVEKISGFAFYRRQSAIIEQSRNPPLGDVSCRLCGEKDETPIHIICDWTFYNAQAGHHWGAPDA